MSQQHNDSTHRLGQIMIYLAWIFFLGILTLMFKKYLDQQNNPNQDIALSYNENDIAEVRLQRNRYGHYLANGRINKHPVTFLLDTGATHISIPLAVAQRLGLEQGSQSRTVTANGTINVYNTRLQSASIGAIELHDVRASINPYMSGKEILLGMNFMKHLEMIQRGNELILRYHPSI